MSSTSRSRHTAYVALGSNLGSKAGDPSATVKAGIKALGRLADVSRATAEDPMESSSLYATSPVGYLEQPQFINAVVSVRTTLGPDAILEVLLEIERSFERVRDIPNGPRTLDLDLLLLDDLVLRSSTLVLPHPRLHTRRFVLAPLAELAPTRLHPVLGRSMAELLAELPDEGEQAISGVRRLGRAS